MNGNRNTVSEDRYSVAVIVPLSYISPATRSEVKSVHRRLGVINAAREELLEGGGTPSVTATDVRQDRAAAGEVGVEISATVVDASARGLKGGCVHGSYSLSAASWRLRELGKRSFPLPLPV